MTVIWLKGKPVRRKEKPMSCNIAVAELWGSNVLSEPFCLTLIYQWLRYMCSGQPLSDHWGQLQTEIQNNQNILHKRMHIRTHILLKCNEFQWYQLYLFSTAMEQIATMSVVWNNTSSALDFHQRNQCVIPGCFSFRTWGCLASSCGSSFSVVGLGSPFSCWLSTGSLSVTQDHWHCFATWFTLRLS